MRNGIIVGGIAALSLVLAACTPSVTVESQPPATPEFPAGIAVSGVGKVTGTPDTLTMSFGVQVIADHGPVNICGYCRPMLSSWASMPTSSAVSSHARAPIVAW